MIGRANPEVDYGCWWRLPNGQHARLSWNVTTGVLYLHHPDRTKGDAALVTCADREAVEDLLAGVWEGDSHRTLEWLAERLWLVGATLPDWAQPVSRGR